MNAEEHLKTVGVEAARNAQREKNALAEQAKKEKDLKDLMTQRMQNLQKLTEGGLAETKKYWQAQYDGATKSSAAFKEAEKNLRLINAEQERLAKVQLQKSAARLGRTNLSTLSEQEINDSIKAAKQIAASMKPTDQAYKDLTANIIRAEEHVKKFGLEGQRSAQMSAQQLQTMRDHMQKLTSLSSAALAETQKYWQAQLDGATKGSRAYREAEKNLKLINAEQEKLTKSQLEASANKLGRANLKTLSGQDLQNSINAAKQLLATMKPTNKAYTDLQNNILRAEEFSKQFGLEAARSAQQAAAKMQKADEFFFPTTVIKDLPLYGNQFIPLGIKTTMTERIRIASLFDSYCNGGSIAHLNIDAPFDSFEKAWNAINYIADQGLTYFAFNTKIQACAHNHAFYGTKCPICGGDVATEYTRIVG